MANNHDETIVVVGGAGGIGSATVRKYAELEKHVIVGDKNEDTARSLADELGQYVDYVPVDVLNWDSIKRFSETIKDKFGTISHFVNLAGGAMTEETIESVFKAQAWNV